MGVISDYLPGRDTAQFLSSEGDDVRKTYESSGPAAAVGRATRTVLTAPLAAAADVADKQQRAAKAIVSPVVNTISNFASGFTGSATQPAPAAAPRPAAPAVAPPVMQTDDEGLGIPPVSPGGAQEPKGQPMDASGTEDAPRPSNVRAYLRVVQPPAAPNVDPEAFARNVVAMKNVDPSASLGQAVDASVNSKAYRDAYLQALHGAQQGYTGETGRISALANAQHAGAQSEESGARTADIEQGTIAKRYTLDQQKELKTLTMKLSDPNLSDKERRDLEQQLLILHGKVPRALGHYQAVPGKLNPMTGTYEPGYVIDTASGAVKPLEVPGTPAASASAAPPQAAVDYLKANPKAAKDFDAKYGAGAAARVSAGGPLRLPNGID